MTQTDFNTPVSELRQIVQDFVNERQWEQFHSPKNLSMSIAIEAAELMEHFQWIGTEQSRELDPAARSGVAEELADVICYSLALANQLELDLTATLLSKMEKNRQKYPIDQFLGRFRNE